MKNIEVCVRFTSSIFIYYMFHFNTVDLQSVFRGYELNFIDSYFVT